MSNYCECHESNTCEWCKVTKENEVLNERVRELEEDQARWLTGENMTVKHYEEMRVLEDKNKQYREAIEKALVEEEQYLEGHQSTVHKILTEALEESK